jgi:hypothetical protein
MLGTRAMLAISLGACAFGQSGVTTGGGAGGGTLGITGTFRVDPPTSGPWAQRFGEGWQTKGLNGYFLAQRYLYDDEHHVFLGYDLMLQLDPKQPDTFKASFFELGISAAELPALGAMPRAETGEWKKLPLAKLPASRTVHVGDTISVEVWTAPDTGQRIIDDVHIEPSLASTLQPRPTPARFQVQVAQMAQVQAQLGQLANRGPLARGAPDVPTVSGTARDFSAGDAEMQLVQPSVSINGTLIAGTSGAMLGNARGSLVWFHLPGRGRYILSLAARPELGFVKAGEIRGGVMTFALGGDEYKVESYVAIATGEAPYTLYLLHDPDWEPTAQSQRGHFQGGSVSPGEIELLRRK